MKNIFLISILYSHLLIYGQKRNINIEVEYKMFCDTELPLVYNTTLWANNKESIYQEKLSTTQRWEKNSSTNGETFMAKDVTDPYLKTDITKGEYLFFGSIINNTFLIKDVYGELKWNLTEETKMIAKYICNKATTNFRGREWIAWFAPDIPLPFGPWKLHGLPGLILEANDSTGRFTIKIVKMQDSESDIFKRDFETLIATKNKTPIMYKQFLEDKEEAIDNRRKQINQEMSGAITTSKAPCNSQELKFEWEE